MSTLHDYLRWFRQVDFAVVWCVISVYVDVKVIPQQAQGVPGRLRPRTFVTFSTTRVVGRKPCAPAAFTPGEIPGTYFQGLSRPQGT
jgi:hypothetical protein